MFGKRSIQTDEQKRAFAYAAESWKGSFARNAWENCILSYVEGAKKLGWIDDGRYQSMIHVIEINKRDNGTVVDQGHCNRARIGLWRELNKLWLEKAESLPLYNKAIEGMRVSNGGGSKMSMKSATERLKSAEEATLASRMLLAVHIKVGRAKVEEVDGAEHYRVLSGFVSAEHEKGNHLGNDQVWWSTHDLLHRSWIGKLGIQLIVEKEQAQKEREPMVQKTYKPKPPAEPAERPLSVTERLSQISSALPGGLPIRLDDEAAQTEKPAQAPEVEKLAALEAPTTATTTPAEEKGEELPQAAPEGEEPIEEIPTPAAQVIPEEMEKLMQMLPPPPPPPPFKRKKTLFELLLRR